MRIALAGGGSGGHLYPGLALSRELLSRDARPLLFGSGRSDEATWVGDAAERIVLDSPPAPACGRELPRFALRLVRAVGGSLHAMRRRPPDLVVGLGGFASVGPGIAALLSGRPLLLLEQNAAPGKANRLLARLGGRLAASCPESVAALPPRVRARARVVGNPIRQELRRGVRDAARFGLDPARPVLLVTGGSQGAAGLNRRVLDAAPLLARRGVQVIHLAGPAGASAAAAGWRAAGVSAFVAAFTDRMGDAYATADLVLARAGGTTIAELTALGRPSVLVPYPHHADRHQERNAEALVRAGGAAVVPEADLDPARFERDVVDRLFDPAALARMAAAAAARGRPDAGREAARFAAEIAAGRRR